MAKDAAARRPDASTADPGPPADDHLRLGWIVAFAVVVGALTLRWMHGLDWSLVDLTDFVEGGRAVLTGRQIYDQLPGVLPFNYPPFGAVVMVPLALVGAAPAAVVMTALSLVAYVVVVGVIASRLDIPLHVTILVGLGGLALEPFIRDLVLGQVNLILVLLVVLDVFVVPPPYRGLLIGIAAGIKLTPAVFGVLYLLRRDWASVTRSFASFAGTVLVGWVLAPASSTRYWLEDLDKTSRFGGDALMTANQSIRAVVVHALGSEQPPLAVWVGLSLFALGTAGLVAAQRVRTGDDVGAVVALAAGGLLASPVSWSHHWVWVVVAILYAVAKRHLVIAWLLAGVFFLAPMWFLPAGGGAELRYAWWQVTLSATYVLVGLMGLVLLAVQRSGRSSPLPG